LKPLFDCELQYFSSPHLYQIYTGFEKLRQQGIVNISIKPALGNIAKPVLTVIINNKQKVIYDTLDGFNWIDDTELNNLKYFKNNFQADFYFKRSYNKLAEEYCPANCRIYPLGLNYPVKPENKIFSGSLEVVKDIIRTNRIYSSFYNTNYMRASDLEFYPLPQKQNKILLIERLWNPLETGLEHLKIERERINQNRINYIKACKKEFGKYFLGGLLADDFSLKTAKELVLPSTITKKEYFVKAVKEHNICIATNGLHNSIVWKLGEYVAASRSIISEQLNYYVPGGFESGKNYYAYKDEMELLDKTNSLLENKDKIFEMMNNNFLYYNNYLKPDRLVLNTLLKISMDII